MRKKPGKFGLRADIGGGPAICLYQQPLHLVHDEYWIPDPIFKFFITWPGACFGMLWRNLLGPLYVPFSPSKRFDVQCARSERLPTRI